MPQDKRKVDLVPVAGVDVSSQAVASRRVERQFDQRPLSSLEQRPVHLDRVLEKHVRVLDAVNMVCELAGYSPEIVLQPDMPVGPMNRVADNSLGKRLLGWEPRVPFADGLRKTLEWYFSMKDPDEVRTVFDHMLTGRGAPPKEPEWVGAVTGESRKSVQSASNHGAR